MGVQKMIVKEAFSTVCNHFGEDEHEMRGLLKRFTGEEGKKLDRDYARVRRVLDKLAGDLDL